MPLSLPKWRVGTGKPKGMLQVLYERDLCLVGTQKEVANAARAKRDPPLPPIPAEMDASATLGRCEDYASEVYLLEQLFLDPRYILIKSVKCHPEMAGCGIEYSWGKFKMDFRRHNWRNGKEKGNQASLMRGKIKKLLDTGMLCLERVWEFELKARTYRRMYLQLHENDGDGTAMADNFIHRCAEAL